MPTNHDHPRPDLAPLDHDDFGGAARDLPRLLGRRRLLGVLAGGGAAALLVACGSDTGGSSTTDAPGTNGTEATTDTAGDSTAVSTPDPADTTASSTAGTDAALTECIEIPEETAGPFPGDGSNGPNVLGEDGVVRADIRTSIGAASGTADGVPLTIRLTVVDLANGCAPMPGAAVYAWHCDRDGNYSMYSAAAANENYLRGVQAAGDDGVLEFTSIFPGAYAGRWPHVHFEVYPDVASATSAAGRLATSQLALPKEACDVVYAEAGYEASVVNMRSLSLDTDNVFRDGYRAQLATVTGDVATGFVATITVAV